MGSLYLVEKFDFYKFIINWDACFPISSSTDWTEQDGETGRQRSCVVNYKTMTCTIFLMTLWKMHLISFYFRKLSQRNAHKFKEVEHN